MTIRIPRPATRLLARPTAAKTSKGRAKGHISAAPTRPGRCFEALPSGPGIRWENPSPGPRRLPVLVRSRFLRTDAPDPCEPTVRTTWACTFSSIT